MSLALNCVDLDLETMAEAEVDSQQDMSKGGE